MKLPNGLMDRTACNVEQHFRCSFFIFGDDVLAEKDAAADIRNR